MKYYKFHNSDAVARREKATVELLSNTGEWVEERRLLRKFIGGDCDFDEITEEEAEAIVKKRKAGTLNA